MIKKGVLQHMKMSTKGRYGLRAMIDLAVYSSNHHVTLSSIAARQGVSLNYLEHVFSLLKKSGLVDSIKGAQGGYALAADPSELTVGQILSVLEGPMSIVDLPPGADSNLETRLQRCIRICVWAKMNDALKELVDGKTLKDLADRYLEKNQIENGIFYI